MPLRPIQGGLKGFVKKLLGRDIGTNDNYARQQFNTLILNEYKDQAIFDLARFESTYPEGNREFTIVDNKKIYSMIPDYTYDRGHLSYIGRNIIGREFSTGRWVKLEIRALDCWVLEPVHSPILSIMKLMLSRLVTAGAAN